jgi:flagellar biosynthetic protein FliP
MIALRILISVLVTGIAGFAVDGASAQDLLNNSTSEALQPGNSLTGTTIQIFLLVTILSLAPGIAMMITCLPFMIIVLSILRQAIGLQQAPPTMMIVSLAMFLTFFVMEPVFMEAWQAGVAPFLEGSLDQQQAFTNVMGPFRTFMMNRINPDTLFALSEAMPGRLPLADGTPSLSLMIPSFMLSEIERGFEIGFVIFLPFLIIDLLVASVLMAMGMMMVPPVVVSLPFKIAFIVLAHGWTKIAGALVQGYAL